MSRDFERSSPISPEPGDTWIDFDELESELNYRRAQATLRDLVGKLDLDSLERSGLESALADLDTMQVKLDQDIIQIAAFGMVGRGKSSLLNALIGRPVFTTGPIHGVTQLRQVANWQLAQDEITIPGSGQNLAIRRAIGPEDAHIQLIDTPGIDEVNGDDRAALAKQVAQQADLLLFVVSGDMTQIEHQALSELRDYGKPMILVFNKVDQYPDVDRAMVYQKICDDRVRELLSPSEIVMASASPLLPVATRESDGRITVKMVAGPPQVEDLKLKILEILQREGKALVALNSMLFADEVNEKVIARKLDIRDRQANQTIWNNTLLKAVAVAVNPITVLDVLSSAAIDVAMILRLSKLYGMPMTEKGAISLLKNIGFAMGGLTASELLATLGLGTLKSLLGVAAPMTGGLSLAPYLSVAITQAGVAGVATYGIGQVAKTYLANGATWGPEGPKAVVGKILSSLDEQSILTRIREELRAKLDRRQK